MEIVNTFDLVKNTNPKSKKFGQFAVSYSDTARAAYFHYFDGSTISTNIKSFSLIKHFEVGDNFLGGKISRLHGWGWMQINYPTGIRVVTIGQIMEEMRKYVICTAKIV